MSEPEPGRWLTGMLEAADKFLGETLIGWAELGLQRPSEFWVDQVHDAVGGVE